MDGPIASAVVLPEEEPELPPPTASSPTSLKRRRSSFSEQEAKRARFDGETASNERRDSASNPNVTATATAPPKGRERGRERRLFGAALGALSQNSATAAQKRRTEIEKRQQAQRRQEDEESEQRKLERLARRKAQRWKEHERIERDSMRVRHDNLLAMAHFLQTTSEPRLHYKPWETTPQDDDRIHEQIAAAEDTIRRELEEAHQEEHAERERGNSRECHADRNADAAHSGKNANAKTPLDLATANDGPTDSSGIPPKNPDRNGDHAESSANEAVREDAPVEVQIGNVNDTNYVAAIGEANNGVAMEVIDETAEEVVEAAEDTVIY